jgi:hypothetical protein
MLYIGCAGHIGLCSDGLPAGGGSLYFRHDFFGPDGVAGVIHRNCKAVACQPCRYSSSNPA